MNMHPRSFFSPVAFLPGGDFSNFESAWHRLARQKPARGAKSRYFSLFGRFVAQPRESLDDVRVHTVIKKVAEGYREIFADFRVTGRLVWHCVESGGAVLNFNDDFSRELGF